MSEEVKQRIIELNNRYGLKTEFIKDADVLGYALGDTIYINESIEHDYEKTNKHELLHFFENTESFKYAKDLVLNDMDYATLKRLRDEYYLRYFGLYSLEEIENGILDTEIVIDIMVDNSLVDFENGLMMGDMVLRRS